MDLIFRKTGFSSEADSLNLYVNLTMVVSEQIIDQLMKTMTRFDNISKSSSVLNLSLSTVLAEYPHTLEYILLGSHFSSAIVKSWTKSISGGNWTDVRLSLIHI